MHIILRNNRCKNISCLEQEKQEVGGKLSNQNEVAVSNSFKEESYTSNYDQVQIALVD